MTKYLSYLLGSIARWADRRSLDRSVPPRSRLYSEAAFRSRDGRVFHQIVAAYGPEWPPRYWEVRGRKWKRRTTPDPSEKNHKIRGRLLYEEA